MQDTPKANRLHIAVFGRRNAGKSSLINAITGQSLALVSPVAGTTTDPVYKAMELLPLGPVMLIDTAGLDDEGEIGRLRTEKSIKVMDSADLALLVFDPLSGDASMEELWFGDLKAKNIPTIGVINKIDMLGQGHGIDAEARLKESFDIPFVSVSAKEKSNIDGLLEAIIQYAPTDFERSTIVGDIIGEKALVLLVAPQDIQAPKGRLILPQVQVMRDLLDHNAQIMTVKDSELKNALESLSRKPDLVITDSQVFKKVNEIIPEDIPLTSFSILMSRYKGDLGMLVEGARAIDHLEPGDKVLISEACTHHALKNDIAREKIPAWLSARAGGPLEIKVASGGDFPDDLSSYKLIVHCGSCMINGRQFMSRLYKAKAAGVPITNFGTAIAHLNGILERVTEMLL
ncbi:[FeFe] hydrogenase H-cluster maturation GTPase HydF [Lutispora saccharofermentans]|uniref:[FeFe] hydrogenase H-cluster maturation GTPase HydF n=1 Tax=Lutispora saccharofermentans TaxID=3024236 RepID=A0ABT1NME2_9FIRM|nr:[FeFe] hydrogenase H-cluster maturation GTPase HydF [Lutispora saccharofermentans]MCQ1531769.1 [FeFe] hydrogenase H-cluster maturation GTPase HydF [Lutispora saccharofermentans]